MLPNRTLIVVLASLIGVAGCASAPPPRAEKPSPSKAVTAPVEAPSAEKTAEAPGEGRCDLVCGAATVVGHTSPQESAEDYTTQAVETANVTLNAMHDDLLACYVARVKAYPKAHAFLTIDIVVAPDGHAQKVEVKGGALLGDGAMACIVNRVERGAFAAPPGGGTMRLEVPLTLRRMAPDESI
jgi:hypothetical protein